MDKNKAREVAIADVIPHEMLTIPEWCAAWRISRSHAYALVAEGKVPAVRLGRRTLVPRAALDRLIGEAIQRLREPVGA